MVLSMTVKSGSVILNAKVLDKDNNNAVIFEQTAVDTPAADVLAGDAAGRAAAQYGSSGFVVLCYIGRASWRERLEVAFDDGETNGIDNVVRDYYEDNEKTD